MPDLENMRIPLGILFMSCIQAEIYVMSYQLPVTSRYLWCLTHPDTRQCLDRSSCVALRRKHRYSRWNVVYASWNICYFLSTSGYRSPSLIYYSPWRRRVFVLDLKTCFWTSTMVVSPGSSLISHSYREIRSVSRHFEFLWAWHIIWRHLRHHKKCARAPLQVSENCIQNSNPDTGFNFAPPAVYVINIGPLFEG